MNFLRWRVFLVGVLAAPVICGLSVQAQQLTAVTAPASLPLPDAPGFLSRDGLSYTPTNPALVQEEQAGQAAPSAPVYARRLSSKIGAGVIAKPLTVGDKFEMSIARQLTLGTLGSSLVSAGYSHLLDNRPHYGTDSAGFGERLGASALRSTTQSILNFGLYSSLFHDDPRYYVLGSRYPVKKRVIYAATRVIFTRKDNGNRAINYPYLAAVASSAALTNAYYPDRDRAVGRTIGGVGTTIALNAAIMQLNEFGGDIKRRLFHKH